MKLLLSLLLYFIVLSTVAQVQFWNTADIENAQWEPYYAQQKIKKIAVFKVDEKSNPIFPDMPQWVKYYDADARLIVSRYNKYNWSKKTPELLSADSFFYNAKGKLIRYSAYAGPRMEYTNGTEILYNTAGQQINHDKYEMENYERKKTGSEMITYSPAGLPVKLVSKNIMAVTDHKREFFYDSKGWLTRATFSSGGDPISTEFTRNDKGLLLSFKEINGKEVTKAVSFLYDDQGRRISKDTQGAGGFRANTTYIYRGAGMLPYASHETWYSMNNKVEKRYEHLVYTYE